MALRRVRLDLARDHDHPNGSDRHGYDFIAPLDDQGHLAASEWREHRERCRVKRFWAGEKDMLGRLVHKRSRAWVFDYNPKSDSDDETGFKFDLHRFVPGEYVSITEHDGVQRTFHVRSVVDLD
ncbi:MAG TPA: hypothetical protein PK264_08905 [Hyphomicrobiaceae bacterium]|nr:hypothetical protein [Hyphomicrobiaceae bacterium]